jgi:hypothetical protein
MKKLLLSYLILLCIQLPTANAQWVTIPDTNFVNKLTQLFPTCMNGNQMDTTCSAILSQTSFYFNGSASAVDIINISGIEFFDNLESLSYSHTNDDTAVHIVRLPPNLKSLVLVNQNYSSLPPLPTNLRYLRTGQNPITTLPALPNTLRELNCTQCELINLPAILPDSLRKLYVDYNQLHDLPTILPDSIEEIYIGNNQITTIPPLPLTVWSLFCAYNQITSLPVLPPNLWDLVCNNNLLTTIPPVPNTMVRFLINDNNITCVNNLPQPSSSSQVYQHNITNNQLQCVPNWVPYVQPTYLYLCMPDDTINNPYNCLSTVNISGKIFSDLNNNCSFNSSDLGVSNIPVQIYDSLNNLVMQDYAQNGSFGFPISQPGVYKVKINTSNLPIAISCGQADSVMINLYSPSSTISNIYFPVQCNQAYDHDRYLSTSRRSNLCSRRS